MKTTYVMSTLSMVLMLAACSKDSGSAPMTPLTSANIQDVKKTMSSFMDVNNAVMTANTNRQNKAGASTTNVDLKSISSMIGMTTSLTGSTPAPSEKANRMASKLTEANCEITVVGLDKLENQSGNINTVGDINASIHVGGADCPMTYDVSLTASQPSQNQASINLSMKFQTNSDDFKEMSEVQSANISAQMIVSGSQSQITMAINGSGGITTLSQGQLSFYANGAITGSQGGGHADIHTGIVYPTFKADLHMISNSGSDGSPSTTQLFLNDQPISQEDLQKTFSM